MVTVLVGYSITLIKKSMEAQITVTIMQSNGAVLVYVMEMWMAVTIVTSIQIVAVLHVKMMSVTMVG